MRARVILYPTRFAPIGGTTGRLDSVLRDTSVQQARVMPCN
jgi:hypothetical protein